MTYPSGTTCSQCLGIAQPGTRNLMGYLLERFPWSYSMGIYNCRVVAGSSSLSKHSCGEALDLGIPTLTNGRANVSLGHQPLLLLAEHAEALGVQRNIYDRVIYDDRSPRGRYYSGVHPHYDHIHSEQTRYASRTLTYATIVDILGPAQGEESMSFLPMSHGDGSGSREFKKSDVASLQAMMNRAYNAGLVTDGVYGDATANAINRFLHDPNVDGKTFTGNRYDDLVWDLAVRAAQSVGTGSSGGATQADIDRAVKAHSDAAASELIHPHRHSEGTTGPPRV